MRIGFRVSLLLIQRTFLKNREAILKSCRIGLVVIQMRFRVCRIAIQIGFGVSLAVICSEISSLVVIEMIF